jgi:hypothetical protein
MREQERNCVSLAIENELTQDEAKQTPEGQEDESSVTQYSQDQTRLSIKRALAGDNEVTQNEATQPRER